MQGVELRYSRLYHELICAHNNRLRSNIVHYKKLHHKTLLTRTGKQGYYFRQY